MPEAVDDLVRADQPGSGRDAGTNPEIGGQLFLSPRTVEWHPRKVFGKRGIGSRKELRSALSNGAAVVPA